ncbi:MAG: cell division protein ZipA C-terminal FtsZ-binding domain-containing protein [Pseudomonadota bacterium]
MSLLAVGALVIVAVYLYSWWQQRQYRKRFSAAFKAPQADALYRTPDEAEPEEKPAEALYTQPDAEPLAEKMDEALAEEHRQPHAEDEACALQEAGLDYIVTITPPIPVHADALNALWQVRFDQGKSVHVCGLNQARHAWERVVAESPQPYAAFRLSLQLVDRGGAISETRLSDFHELARGIATALDAALDAPPVHDTAERALDLDAFCAEVDQSFGLNLMPAGGRQFSAADVARAAEQNGLTLQADGAFHLVDARGHTLFSLCNSDNSPFQHHTLDQVRVDGLSLLLDVPNVETPLRVFDEMVELANKLATALRASVVDDRRVPLSSLSLALIRTQIEGIEKRMTDRQIVPGSPQARRLFA